VVRVQANVELSLSGSISSQAVLGRYPNDRTRVDVELSGPRTDVEPNELGLMSNRAGSGRCRTKRAWDDVDSYGPGLMLSRAGQGRCRVVWARVDVKSSNVEPMWSCPSPG